MIKPTLLVEVVFLPPTDGGRKSPPVLDLGHYRPHLVVQDRSARYARIRGNVVEEDYLGVSFVEGAAKVVFGEPQRCVLNHDVPEVNYDGLREGAMFTVREGAELWVTEW